MVNHISKQIMHFGLFIMVLLSSTNSVADGGIVVLSEILEEVRITVSPKPETATNTISKNLKNAKKSAPSLGAINYEHVDCTNCATGSLSYGPLTQLVNPFGAKKPIEELESWSGSRAQIHYRAADNHIEKIKILP
tara:strand:- start:63003 stop:63410 length:408 start_codon:yes stop_codon:yes gene_type:complete